MRLRLLYHGQCFDGVASAAVFTRFYRAHVSADAQIAYAPLLHTPGSLFDETMFDGDENAIVDFKYSPSPRLTWWFDHHQSAFLTPEDEAHFRARPTRAESSGTRKASPARSSSSASPMERFGFLDTSLDPLVQWAHVIDGAFYESAAQPVELREPALQLMQVIENAPPDFIEGIIRGLSTRSLEEVATSEEVQARFRPLLARHQTVEAVRRKAAYDAASSPSI